MWKAWKADRGVGFTDFHLKRFFGMASRSQIRRGIFGFSFWRIQPNYKFFESLLFLNPKKFNLFKSRFTFASNQIITLNYPRLIFQNSVSKKYIYPSILSSSSNFLFQRKVSTRIQIEHPNRTIINSKLILLISISFITFPRILFFRIGCKL